MAPARVAIVFEKNLGKNDMILLEMPATSRITGF